jgi:hypothetical protein
MIQNVFYRPLIIISSQTPFSFWEGDLRRNNIGSGCFVIEILKYLYLLLQSNSKMCFEYPQNCFKALETILPTPLKVGANLTPKS